MKRHIPNLLTCCNLVSGCIAVRFALCGATTSALLFIIIGAAFDFADGWSARLIGVSSPIGKELDSLADCITFGLAPSSMLFAALGIVHYPSALEAARPWLPYVAFVMAAFSALRLAKFNIDERQTTSFIGMPTPVNALFWASLLSSHIAWAETLRCSVVVLIALMCVCSWLLVSEVPMFALKFKHYGWKGNEVRYVFLIIVVLLVAVMGIKRGICASALCYILISILARRRSVAGKFDF